MTKSYTSAEWIELAQRKHAESEYDYTHAFYINADTKIEIICKIHGSFWQLPRKHLKGSKCPSCARANANNYRKTDVGEFCSKSNKVHNNKYDYSNVELNNLNTKVRIVCPIHGEFRQRAINHLNGHGCKKCNSSRKPIPQSKPVYDTTWFVKKAIEVHGQYDYSNSSYNGSASPIAVICPKHGEFTQVARDHLNGYGCPACGLELLSADNRRSKEEFIELAHSIHGRYDYACVEYVNQDWCVVITCPVHGDFSQKPRHHLRGQGCPKCQISSGHSIICNWLDATGIKYDINHRDIITPLEVDIYVPSRRVAIEYHGIYWHSYQQLETKKQKYRHWNKATAACNKDILLLQIFEHELLERPELVRSVILNKLGMSDRLYARKLELRMVSNKDVESFYNINHLLGYRPSTFNLALCDGEIKCCMSFNKRAVHEFELMRYACKIDCTVVGGPSKLLSNFIRIAEPECIMSYADRRYSNGSMYAKLGFELSTTTKPGYYYVLGTKVFSRHQFQKHKLATKLDLYNEKLSEPLNMFLNGYRRLWDAGHYKYLWRQP